jgi:spermidine synthase
MQLNLVFLGVAFLEGYISLATQILAIRKFAPFFGMATPQTSLIIGIFLLFMAMGYASGEKKNQLSILRSNFLWLLGLFSFTFVSQFIEVIFQWSFEKQWPDLIILGIYTSLTVGPMSYLFGRTMPILVKHQGHAGYLLAVSTLGAFLGAVITPMVFLHFYGVTATVMLNVILILVLIFLVTSDIKFRSVSILLAILSLSSNYYFRDVAVFHSNEYNDYAVEKNGDFRGLILNRTRYESFIDGDDNSAWYNEEIHRLYLKNKKALDVLVLGAGGFTLALKNSHHRYQFVDIDPQIQEVVSKNFNSKAKDYVFHGKDARQFLNENKQKFDFVFFDLYRVNSEIPPQLTTIEALRKVKYSLKENGLVALNIKHHKFYQEKFGRRFHLTLNKVFPFCYNSPQSLDGRDTLSLYLCLNSENQESEIITDDKN